MGAKTDLMKTVGYLAACGLVMASCRSAVPPPFMANTDTWVMTSAITKRTYQVSVALPRRYDVSKKVYPVLYAVDANWQFGTLVETARGMSIEGIVPDLIIVGIGYPVGEDWKAAGPRVVDLTPTVDAEWVAKAAVGSQQAGLPPPEGSGGAPGYIRYIKEELIPRVEGTYRIAHDDRAFYGHSVGALFGFYVLLNNDGMFKRFILGSPSLWWNNRVIFSQEETYAAARNDLQARVFMSVGASEDDSADYAMVTNFRKLVDIVKVRNYEGLDMRTYVFEEETHNSVVAATIAKGLRYIYAR